jgi:oxalate decarboxylase/phosphoglucose isomerase-like protein (cupin superfamily)
MVMRKRIARIRSSISSTARRRCAWAARRDRAGALVMIPAGARHHVRNPGGGPLFFVTIYAPPEY